MANISTLLNTIKNAIYGRDMRSALHDSIESVNDDVETRLSRSGGTMNGGIDMNDNKVTSSAVPSADDDYVNKKYVDDSIGSIHIVSGKESKVDTYFYEGAQTIYKIDGNEGMVYGGAEYFLFVTGSYDPFAMFYRSYQYKFVNCAIYVRSETDVNSRIWNDWKKIDGNVTDVKINGTSVVTDGMANISYANAAEAGVIKVMKDWGFDILNGFIKISSATDSEIDNYTNSYHPIVPSNLHYAVRSVYPIVKDSLDSSATCTLNTIYNLGVQSNTVITLPAAGQTDFNKLLGSFIQVDLISGTTPTTLSITSSAGILGFDLIPEANMAYSLYFDWGIIDYSIIATDFSPTDIVYTYGWRCAYSEYDISTIGG